MQFPRWLIAALSVLVGACGAYAAEPARLTATIDGHPFAVWHKPALHNGRAVPIGAAPALVLVHGRTWSSRPDFDLQVAGEALSLQDGLAAAGIGTYAVDMRGYGATPRDASGWLTPDRAAADLSGIVRWLNAARGTARPGSTPAHLFGWSYGSMMAQLATQRAGDTVASLTLFGYPVRPGSARTPAEMPYRAPARANTAANAASDFITPGSISQRAIDGFVAAALAHDPIRVDWRQLEQWQALDGAAVSVPTLLLQAEFDTYTRTLEHQRLFAALGTPHKLWLHIGGGDHAAFVETPRPNFIAALVAFIQRHDQAVGAG